MFAMRENFSHKFNKVLERTQYSTFQKLIVQKRYVDVVMNTQRYYTWTRVFYFGFSFLITLGGVLVASFASFDRIGITNATELSATGAATASAFAWVVWCLGIVISVANGMMLAFNIPKKYVLNYVTLEKFHSEGWLFLAGTGRYEKIISLDDRFKTFCKRIEKIKMKSIETMPEMGSSEANDILSSGYNDSDQSDKTPPQTPKQYGKLTTTRRSKMGISPFSKIIKVRSTPRKVNSTKPPIITVTPPVSNQRPNDNVNNDNVNNDNVNNDNIAPNQDNVVTNNDTVININPNSVVSNTHSNTQSNELPSVVTPSAYDYDDVSGITPTNSTIIDICGQDQNHKK